MIRIVVLSPRLDLGGGILQSFKPVQVQTFIAEAAVKGFNGRVVVGLPRRLKSRMTLFVYAQRSIAAPTNSLPLSQ
jgi:hypothetical protein